MNSKVIVASLFYLFCVIFFTPFSQAEIIQLKNGRAIKTKILREDDKFITVQAPNGKIKLAKSSIQSIWRGSQEELMEVSGKALPIRASRECWRLDPNYWISKVCEIS